MHTTRFPNESPEYRRARNDLLEAERELRRQTERVAEQRRSLPPGGALAQDYLFHEVRTGKPVRFSELFGDKETLAVYSFMYGPEMKAACPSCTSILDSLDGAVVHLEQRIALAVVAKSPPERIRAHADLRGWTRLPLYSSNGTTYNHDYHGEDENAKQIPNMNVFTRRDGAIRHFTSSELLFEPSDPGQNTRHVDSIWPLWNVLDMTSEGRGSTFQPRLSYEVVAK